MVVRKGLLQKKKRTSNNKSMGNMLEVFKKQVDGCGWNGVSQGKSEVRACKCREESPRERLRWASESQ